MSASKIRIIIRVCFLTIVLTWVAMPTLPAVAIGEDGQSDSPQADIEEPSPHQSHPLEQVLLLREQGLDAVLDYANTLAAGMRRLVQPEIDALMQPESTQNLEVSPYVGINNNGCVYYSIQSALSVAGPGDTIKVTAGVHYDMPDVTSHDLTIRGGYDTGCINHSGAVTILDGDGTSSVFDISLSSITLQDFSIQDGGGSGAGIDVYNASHVTLDNTDITLNNGAIGGGINISITSYVTATNGSEISHNTASLYGGGIAAYGEFHGFSTDSDITYNSARHGGGIYTSNGYVLIRGPDMYQNDATAGDGKGGAIYAINAAEVNVLQLSYIYYLNTAYNGAGIYADASTVSANYANFRDNHATNDGGAIYLTNGSTLTGIGTYIGQKNTSLDNLAVRGAGIFAIDSTITLTDAFIGNNTATYYGAGLYASSSTVTLENVIVGGSAGDRNELTGTGTIAGVGIYLSNGSTASLSDTTVSHNAATGLPGYTSGMGVYVSQSTFTAENSYFEEHNAVGSTAGRGGAIYLADSSANLSGCGVYTNTASHEGGGIRVWGNSTLTMMSSGVYNNRSTASNGGGIGALYGALGAPTITLVSTDFLNNQAEIDGGAISLDTGTIDIDGAWQFLYNAADEHGGAIAVRNANLTVDTNYSICDPTATLCNVFGTNHADNDNNHFGFGGAIYAMNSSVSVNHTRLYNNSANMGGAIFQDGTGADLAVRNSAIFDNNVTGNLGAGIRSQSGTTLLRHVTLAENSGGAGYSHASTDATIRQSIAWGNSNGGFWMPSGTVTSSCNIDQSGNVGSATNPDFVYPGCNDFHLKYTSPAVDACSNGLSTDLDGVSRPVGSAYDMGAYERTWDLIFVPMAFRNQ